MDKRIKIIIVDDHEIFIQGLELLLDRFPEFYVVGTAGNGLELFERLKISVPDVVLLDLSMPVMNGDEALKVLQARYPNIRVIILSMDICEGVIDDYFKNGAHGFLPKNCNGEILRAAINTTASNGDCKELSLLVLDKLKQKTAIKISQNLDLSVREIDVLKLVTKGKRNKYIADVLCIALRTVEWHKTSLFKKTGCDTDVDLANYANKHGIK